MMPLSSSATSSARSPRAVAAAMLREVRRLLGAQRAHEAHGCAALNAIDQEIGERSNLRIRDGRETSDRNFHRRESRPAASMLLITPCPSKSRQPATGQDPPRLHGYDILAMAMPDSITLSLVDGVRLVVPDSLNLITPYVLTEQQDWFEDELRFLRRLLGPGCEVIDIGANYGTYTLCMAKAVGPQGRVWAFEPSSSCAMLLGEGIAATALVMSSLNEAPYRASAARGVSR